VDKLFDEIRLMAPAKAAYAVTVKALKELYLNNHERRSW
jgi:hypothetical protein